MSKISEFEEQEIINEDLQIAEIEKLTDPEEIEAAKQLILEDIEAEEKGESKKETSPETKSPEELAKEKETLKEGEKQPEPPKEFSVTDEFIQKQPEESREILNKYKGKGKADLAKASAHAIALKNPYIKDNEQAIEAIAKGLEEKTEDEIVKTLIETQKETGKPEAPAVKPEPKKIELPELEETEEVKMLVQEQTIAKLKKIYPDMPEDMSSVEYKEWKRDLRDVDDENADKFNREKEQAQIEVKTDLRKVIYLEKNHATINNERLENEVKVIKDQLGKFGLTEKDLGLDLTLTKDDKGLLFNENLNSLMINGNQPDPYIVGYVGDLAFLKSDKDKDGLTPLAKKLFLENNLKLLQILTNKETINSRKEIERIKEENLNVLTKTPTGKLSEVLTPDAIEKINDESALQKVKQDLIDSIE